MLKLSLFELTYLPVPHVHPHTLLGELYVEDGMIQTVHICVRLSQGVFEEPEHLLIVWGMEVNNTSFPLKFCRASVERAGWVSQLRINDTVTRRKFSPSDYNIVPAKNLSEFML